MGKNLEELLEQRPDQTLANQVKTLFYPDPAWAYEKDTGLPAMFRFSARLGDIPYSVKWLGKKEKHMKPIGKKFYDEIINIDTYLNILEKRGSSLDALVPFFVELYGMKENLIDQCGSLEQLFSDASYKSAMIKIDKAEKLKHAGVPIIRKALQNIPDIGLLFPYNDIEDQANRGQTSRIIEFCENQKQFLMGLLDEARIAYEKAAEASDPRRNDYFELQTDIRCVILWLAMHKVPWALRIYSNGTLIENSKGGAEARFPIGYYYTNTGSDYRGDFDSQNKVYAYSMEKTMSLLKAAENEYSEMKKQYRTASENSSASQSVSTTSVGPLLSAGKALYNSGLYQEAFDALRPLAEENDKEALQLCAAMLLENQVKPVGWDLTFRLLESEYDRGNLGISELLCSLYLKKGNRTNAVFWGERGARDGYPDCYFTLAQMYTKSSKEYNEYISKGAVAGSPICCYFHACNHYDRHWGFLGKHYSARKYAQKALDGGIKEAADLIREINDDEVYWDSVNERAKLAEIERFREQDERDRVERAAYWQKELSFLSSLNDPYTAIDSTGRMLTVDPNSATATDGSKTYNVSEENLKNMRVQRMLNRDR